MTNTYISNKSKTNFSHYISFTVNVFEFAYLGKDNINNPPTISESANPHGVAVCVTVRLLYTFTFFSLICLLCFWTAPCWWRQEIFMKI